MMRKSLKLLSIAVLVGVMAYSLFGWVTDACETRSCADQLDKACARICKNHGGTCFGFDYGWGICLHGICQFEVEVWCIDGTWIWTNLYCNGVCPL